MRLSARVAPIEVAPVENVPDAVCVDVLDPPELSTAVIIPIVKKFDTPTAVPPAPDWVNVCDCVALMSP